MLAVRISLVMVSLAVPKHLARASMVSPLLRLSRISGKCLRTSAVRALCGTRGPGLMGMYSPFRSSNRMITRLSQPNEAAISERVSPLSRRALMSGKCSSRRDPIRPRERYGFGGAFRKPLPNHRPLRTMSSALSCWVPRNKWPGLVHSVVSQWWQTKRPSGIGPKCISQETRCARKVVFADGAGNWPYPSFPLVPAHCQHPAVLITAAQNFSSTVRMKIAPVLVSPHYSTSVGG